MPPKRNLVTADSWWIAARGTFKELISYYLERAEVVSNLEKGHACGHEFEISVRSKSHVHLFGSEEFIDDEEFNAPPRVITVRAQDLLMALLLAATRPLKSWAQEEEGESDV